MNIIPAKSSTKKILNYFCTWFHQAHAAHGRKTQDFINESLIFSGDQAWCRLFPEIRDELFFVMDDGWDVPYNADAPGGALKCEHYKALEPHPSRFPSLSGTPAEKLGQLNERIKAEGWHGLGLWIATNAFKNGLPAEYHAPDKEVEDWWLERILNSREAGINYWKADWGHTSTMQFRRMMTEIGHIHHPELLIEHGRGHAPYNGTARLGDCRTILDDQFFCMMTGWSLFSDVLRTYDVAELENATTLDRIETYARTARGILNCEHLVYIGAVLGCSLGLMNSPINYPAGLEPVAAVRWHRAAPPFSGGEVNASEKILTERHYLDRPTWYYEDGPRDLYQQAAAVISRRTALPEVCNGEEKWIPFVAASMNPSGAYTVGTFRRQSDDAEPVLADVVCRPEQPSEKIGMFGNFSSAVFDFTQTGRKAVRVCAQGLIRGDGADITETAVQPDGTIRIDHEMIEKLFYAEDKSEPAIMLAVEYGE